MSTGIRGNLATSTSTSSTSASGPSLLWTPVDSEDKSLRGFVRSFDEVTAIIKSFEVASSFTYVKEYDRCHAHGHDDDDDDDDPARPSGGPSVSTAKQQKVRFQDIRDSVIPEDGVPFLTERTISYACMFGRDKNAARKKRGEEERAKHLSGDHPTKKYYKKIMESKKKGCTAGIHVKQVSRFIDYKDCNSKWSKRKASEEIRLARLRGETLASERRFYIRLPSHEDHQKTHSVGEVSFAMEACTPEPVQAVVGEKRDFGSFHSSNVQELVEAAEDSYLPPSFPFEVPAFTHCKDLTFGEEARRKHFLLEDCTFLNHGAFGATLKDALDVAQQWQRYIERQPLRFLTGRSFHIWLTLPGDWPNL
ncbi:uncharacterized protein LOC100889690 [Strongylocentrotus purpuratus]|uniref:Uncharacterized protein n=1 Tax=Strongylocentrotus purpuratus TaxID=7668 RepID=A0A7M7PE59_STRPU|nr:uncharacterized protein LOC100889690 [Strongylocentrotus purpuratus]